MIGKHVLDQGMRKVNLVACNFTHRWTDDENFFACGAGEPAAQARKLFRGGAREKKSVGFVDEGGKVPRGAEVKYIDIVLFVSTLCSAYQCYMYKKVMVLSCYI